MCSSPVLLLKSVPTALWRGLRSQFPLSFFFLRKPATTGIFLLGGLYWLHKWLLEYIQQFLSALLSRRETKCNEEHQEHGRGGRQCKKEDQDLGGVTWLCRRGWHGDRGCPWREVCRSWSTYHIAFLRPIHKYGLSIQRTVCPGSTDAVFLIVKRPQVTVFTTLYG